MLDSLQSPLNYSGDIEVSRVPDTLFDNQVQVVVNNDNLEEEIITVELQVEDDVDVEGIHQSEQPEVGLDAPPPLR